MAKVKKAKSKKNLQQKLDVFVNRFKLGTHHTIERTGVITGVVLLTGTVMFSGVGYYAVEASRADISQTSVYLGGQFTSSRTQQKGAVQGLYVNEERTRAMVLMRFQNPEMMPRNANDYYVYVTGMKGNGPDKVAQATVGSIYSFADTGYLGVLLEAPTGFNEQLLNLTVRAKKELASVSQEISEEQIPGRDETFKLYDQWRVVVNPTAETAEYSEALEETEKLPSIRDFYLEHVLHSREAAIRKELDGQLAKMRSALDRVETYTEALATTRVDVDGDMGVRLLPPVAHDLVAGDRVEGLSAAELTQALVADQTGESIEGVGSKTMRARVLDTWPTYMVNTYRLVTDGVVPGGYNFDWRSTTIEDGYIGEVIPDQADPVAWMTEYARTPVDRTKATISEWQLSNGLLLHDYRAGDERVKPLRDLANNLSQAYTGYLSTKMDYQRSGLQKLLLLEAELDRIMLNSVVVSGPEAVEFRL